jgi:hypothetical protein
MAELKINEGQGRWSMLTILHCQSLYFFLAAFTGFFAIVLTFLTIPTIKYALLLINLLR